jgi:TetR/AcrR family transcriptional regulator, transcriptional repressor of bet genes
MGRPSNKELRRSQIGDAFQHVLAARGYGGATIVEIARAAGVPQGLVHYHFRDKEEMLLVLVARFSKLVSTRFETRLARFGRTPHKALYAYIDAHVDLGDDADPDAVAAWVAVGAEAIHQPAVQAIYRQVIVDRIANLRRLFARCLREQRRPMRGIREMAASVAAAIEGAYQISSAAKGLLPRGSASPMIKKMAQGLLGEDLDA